MELFEDRYDATMSVDEAVLLGLEGLQMSTDDSLDPAAVEIGIVQEGEKFTRLSRDQVGDYLGQLGEAS